MMRGVFAVIGILVLAQAQTSPDILRVRVQEYLDAWRAAGTFPGAAVGIAFKNGGEFAVTTGISDRAAGTPVKPTDLFMAGSTGKTFFAAVAVLSFSTVPGLWEQDPQAP